MQNEITSMVKSFFSPSEKLYFFTVTLKPKLYKYVSYQQFIQTMPELVHIFHSLNLGTKNTLPRWFVIAELTKEANVHYHGIVHADDKDILYTFINKVKRNRKLGFVKVNDPVKTQEMFDRVLNYLLKEYDRTRKQIVHGSHKPYIYMCSITYESIISKQMLDNPEDDTSALDDMVTKDEQSMADYALHFK